ncbi:MAG TPA: hypothetical protein VNY27_10940 [Solirubrobacteraceae bacterium]|nr:hypothetical protein [Solirubrobacteraceae bacterium]
MLYHDHPEDGTVVSRSLFSQSPGQLAEQRVQNNPQIDRQGLEVDSDFDEPRFPAGDISSRHTLLHHRQLGHGTSVDDLPQQLEREIDFLRPNRLLSAENGFKRAKTRRIDDPSLLWAEHHSARACRYAVQNQPGELARKPREDGFANQHRATSQPNGIVHREQPPTTTTTKPASPPDEPG